MGSFVFSLLFLPVIGAIGVLPQNPRKDFAFWEERAGPDYWSCLKSAVDFPPPPNALQGCATGHFQSNLTKVGSFAQASECVCRSGIFLGWGSNWFIYIALAVSVFHSWITGVLVMQFSSVYRAVCDGIPVVLLYFFLEPLASRIPLQQFEASFGSRHLP